MSTCSGDEVSEADSDEETRATKRTRSRDLSTLYGGDDVSSSCHESDQNSGFDLEILLEETDLALLCGLDDRLDDPRLL